ncbi:Por secretion system C-terminal sorting domain-containing protein [Chitinophaga sp. CF118]|uniref:S8 family peptidase n=1 Tax=Chitinophaga sp. CF118 TaxID=1884367 RepID=UPI0008EEF743|nr:S8 family peptidase [Chitinophaga sp. CF118]SFE86154.1 Por secretion system C-terminal sorting domain-containing protein [Chitinophaga sp. CF118]
MKTTLILLSILLWQNISARQLKPSDSVSLRYAVTDTAVRSSNNLRYYLVKFNVNPGSNVQQYGVVKTISPLHYILRGINFDSSLQQKVIYSYPANSNWKASLQLLQQLTATAPTDSITFQAGIGTVTSPINYCSIRKQSGTVLRVTIQQKDWQSFITQPVILFADRIRKPKGEILINTADPSANAVNTAQQQYPLIKGYHITVSLKEDLFDTTDIDFTGRYLPSAAAATQVTSHATIMATTIGGAGNTGAKSLGAAPQVKFVSADFNTTLLPEDAAYFQQYDITLQNHSYGTGIENYYGLEAVAYDEQVYTTDTILHVFSSGNIGTEAPATGTYQGLAGYANLSGTFKQAKNVLVIGGTDDSLHAISLSSGGPAYDGRVKPEIVAFGIDGTSGAAAITSGVAALLLDAYRQQYGKAPSAALVKALMINSAVKVNHVPLSHKGGYGSLHALAALNTLKAGQFLTGKGSQHFTVTVPPGMQHLRVTLCWNDPPAVLNTDKALVNDLDLVVTDSQGHTYAPWILSAGPSVDSLSAAARRGRDSLNNVEQVTIDNPAAGTLQIQVNSPAAGQSFYVVYDWTPQKSFMWLSPGHKEVLLSGETLPLPIRWQSNITGKGDLSYSIDSGSTWQSLSKQLSAEQGLYYWFVPNTFSAALLKFTTTDTSFISDTFYLSPRLPLQTGYDCGDSAFIYWPSQDNATAYEVFQLGEQYLTPYKLATDTFQLLTTGGSPYFAVNPIHKDGWAGLKSYGTNYKLQGTGCYFKSLLADVTANNGVLLSLSLGTSYQLKHLYWERSSSNGYITLSDEAVTGTEFTHLDETPPQGLVYYRARLLADNGKVIYSDPAAVYLLNNSAYLFFPNPVHNTLQILSKETANLELHMYDMSGRLLLKRALYSQVESITVQDLPAGVYNCVLFSNGKKVLVKKIVKE